MNLRLLGLAVMVSPHRLRIGLHETHPLFAACRHPAVRRGLTRFAPDSRLEGERFELWFPARPTQPQRRSLCSVNDNGAGGRSWVVGSARSIRPERDTGWRHPAAAALGWRPFRDKFGVVGLEQQPASDYRAAAARARRLRAFPTTRRLKEHLGEEVAGCERLAEEIERASEPDFAQTETAATSRSETAGQ